MEQYVRKQVCDLQCRHTKDEQQALKKRVGGQDEKIEGLQKVVNSQIRTLEAIANRLEDLDGRIKQMEDRPQRHWEKVLETVTNWGTLLLLGLVSAKIGL